MKQRKRFRLIAVLIQRAAGTSYPILPASFSKSFKVAPG